MGVKLALFSSYISHRTANEDHTVLYIIKRHFGKPSLLPGCNVFALINQDATLNTTKKHCAIFSAISVTNGVKLLDYFCLFGVVVFNLV